VPGTRAAAYARAVRTIVAAHGVDLLNVTVRHVAEDRDTVLRYAASDVLGLVMLFHHARTVAADQRMRAATRDLIDASIEHGGRYYLPYRSHATRAQLDRAYPEAEAFRAYKRAIDPDTMFQSRFFQRYLAPTRARG
jgi:FAD/FMN-containing dehydrogenase